MTRALAWLTASDGGIELAIDVTVVLVALFVLLFVARLIRRVVNRYINLVPNLSKLLQVFLVGLVYWLVLAFGLMIVLSALGVDISPVFALIGGASFILAFAFQDTLGNLASGLMIMINRPFDEGDFVDIGGVAGTVKAVSIVATTVTTPDNQVIVIPNKNVWGNVITNVTTSETRRVDLTFGIGYDDDIEKAQRVLEDVVAAHPAVLNDPAPTIRVSAMGASSVDFIVRPWTRTVDYWGVYWDLTRQVKQAFDAAGISIPYPQQDVHIKQVAAAPASPDRHPSSGTSSSMPPTDDAAAAMARGDD
jgi:small conductance mechanosensitive channel